MKDQSGQEIQVGAKVRFHHSQHAGTVIGFEQVGTVHENVVIRNHEVGHQREGESFRRVNTWPWDIKIVGQRGGAA